MEYCPNFQAQPQLLARLESVSRVRVVRLHHLTEEESRAYLVDALEEKFRKNCPPTVSMNIPEEISGF
ncbi:MAG: hypothetical protein ACLRMZ_15325 [Blautia marasmi]